MSVTITPVSTPFATRIVVDAISNATGENNVLGGAGTVFMVRVDNTLNGAATFTKLYDALAPTVGTTDPDFVFKTPASVIREYVLGAPGTGHAFATGVSFASVTAGGTGGTTSPSSSTVVQLLAS